MCKLCLCVFSPCCSPPLTLIHILSASKVLVVTKWAMWKSRKNSKTKERNLELEVSFPQLENQPFPLLFQEHSLQIPPSACLLLSAPRFPHKVTTCASPASRVSPVCQLLSLRTRKRRSSRVAVRPSTWLQMSAQHCGFLLSWLQGLTLALRRPASLREPGALDTQPACLALGSWFQHLADGYRLWWTLVSGHYFSVRGIMVLSVFVNLTRNWFPGS